jgi:hypothetical protein
VGWDREQYRLEVLEPARRAGNVPPADLYVRYGVPSDIRDPAAFSERVTTVVAYWQELKNKRTYARLAETLIRTHDQMNKAGRLTLEKFAENQAHSHREQMDRLTRLAGLEAGRATHVGPVDVARLHGALGGSVTEDQVREALGKAGVRIVDRLPELPARLHPKLADLTQHVQGLGLLLSPEVVFGDAMRSGFVVLSGFRLSDGRRLTEAAISEARSRVDALPYSDPAKVTMENVLAILRGAARNSEELNTLLLSEITGRLQQLAATGFPQRAIAGQAHELGLDEDEAGLIAAAMLAGDTLGTVRQQAEEELAEGRLRSAQRLAAALPADDALRQRIAEREAEVTALVRRADQELAAGRTERAASLLHEAMTMASDDDHLPERLASLPPPPPRRAAARVDGDHVLITWEPSPARAGRVHYRVTRGQGRAPASAAEGTAVVTQTGGDNVSDPEAPPGVPLFYSVFATRGGNIWSQPTATQSVMFTPDVADLSVQTAETCIAFSWRAHPSTSAVLATRAEGHPPSGPGNGTALETSLAGLTDTGLRTGVEYFYHIAACYRTPSGEPCQSAGIVVPVVPEPPPGIVTSLDVRAAGDGGSGVVATWVAPQHGQVRLTLTGKPPAWPPGTRITPDEAARLNRVSGVPQRGADGRDFLNLKLPPGRHYLVALTAAGRAIVVGDYAEIGLSEPIRELSALRLHDMVRLSWVWPDGATNAVVRWHGGEHHCSRRVYEDEGGLTLCVGRAETFIEVCALYSHPDGQLTAPSVRTRVPALGIALKYRIHRASRLHPRQRVIEILAEQPTELPPLVVVRATSRYAPDDPADGEPVAHIAPQPVAPGKPVRVLVELPKGHAWLACFVDPGISGMDTRGVLLFPPAADEMRIR